MNQLVTIQNNYIRKGESRMNQPQVIELQNQRLLTTEQLADFYGATVDAVKKNFSRNKDKFTESKHFFLLEGEELKKFKNEVTDSHLVGKNANQLYLWTKQGASRHSKMLGTDQAWDMFDELEENYFNPRPQNVLMTPQEQLRLMFEYQEDTGKRVDSVEKEVIELKANKFLSVTDYNTVGSRVNAKVTQVIKERHLLLTQKQRGLLYKELNTDIKRVTGARNRANLREKDFETVMDLIDNWQPSYATLTNVRQIELIES